MMWLLYTLIYLWVFWALYVLIMGLYRLHLLGKLSWISYSLGAPWLIIGLVVDVLANLTIATLVFWDLPREWLVTKRLKRYNRELYGWRAELATFICDHILDVFDPHGDHC